MVKKKDVYPMLLCGVVDFSDAIFVGELVDRPEQVAVSRKPGIGKGHEFKPNVGLL